MQYGSKTESNVKKQDPSKNTRRRNPKKKIAIVVGSRIKTRPSPSSLATKPDTLSPNRMRTA